MHFSRPDSKLAAQMLMSLCCLYAYIFTYAYAAEPLPLYEQKIKAGLVYNLLKYTEWQKIAVDENNKSPENPTGAKLQICIFGDDPFDGYLSPLEGRTAQQATITISHVSQVQQTAQCSAVIIHRNQAQQLNPLLQFLRGKNVLTISDIAQFAELGGMVEMTRQDEKIALHINKEALDSAKLSIDARMLKLATLVASKDGV
jgi:hypothetical protein